MKKIYYNATMIFVGSFAKSFYFHKSINLLRVGDVQFRNSVASLHLPSNPLIRLLVFIHAGPDHAEATNLMSGFNSMALLIYGIL